LPAKAISRTPSLASQLLQVECDHGSFTGVEVFRTIDGDNPPSISTNVALTKTGKPNDTST